MYNGNGSFARTGSGSDSSAGTQTDGWNLSEQGSSVGASFALSSYGFSEQESGSDSANDSSGWSETISGTNEGQTYSGTDSGSESDTQGDNSSGALSEMGSASGGSLSLSVVSYSGSGSDSASASDSDGGNWSGSFSGSDSANASQSDSGNYTVSALGNYSNGSMSLSSYVLSGGSSGSSSQSASEADTLKTLDIGTMSGSENFSRADTAAGQQSNEIYQSGVETAGSYANVSYSLSDTSAATVTEQTAVPSYTSSDSWHSAETLTDPPGVATVTSSTSLGFTDTNDTGSGSSTSLTTMSETIPKVLADMPAPDASSVPVVGADESGGGMPVSSPSLGVVGEVGSLLGATGDSAQEATQPASTMAMEPPGAAAAPTQAPPVAKPTPELTQGVAWAPGHEPRPPLTGFIAQGANPNAPRPDIETRLPDRVTKELPPGEGRTPAENCAGTQLLQAQHRRSPEVVGKPHRTAVAG